MKSLLLSVLILVTSALTRAEGAGSAEPKIQLLLFGAPWCGDCVRELPELQRLLEEQVGTGSGDLKTTLYAVTGSTSSTPPTAASATQFAKELGLKFETAPDPWRWQTYKKYFPTAPLGIPAAVVLDAQGNVLKAFPPECNAGEVAAFVTEQLTPSRPESLYLIGEVETTSATGSHLNSSVYLIKRTVIPAENRVEIRTLDLRSDKSVGSHTTLMAVTGNQYTVTDPAGSYTGTGSWTGTPWKWKSWRYQVKWADGSGGMEGEDHLSETNLRMTKRYHDRDGKLLRTVSANFSMVSERAYQILATKLVER